MGSRHTKLLPIRIAASPMPVTRLASMPRTGVRASRKQRPAVTTREGKLGEDRGPGELRFVDADADHRDRVNVSPWSDGEPPISLNVKWSGSVDVTRPTMGGSESAPVLASVKIPFP